MPSILDRLSDDQAMKFINQVSDPFKSLPHLPKNIMEFIVKITPYLAIFAAVVSIVGGPLEALVGALGSLVTLNPIYLITMLISSVIAIANAILFFLAFNALKNREVKGWVYIFWSQILQSIEIIVSLLDGRGSSLISSIIGIVLGFYILFEMRPYYVSAKVITDSAKK